MRIERHFLFLWTLLIPAVGIAGMVEFPETINEKSETLVKVGEGSLRWMFIKVYDGALYLDQDNPDTDPLSDVAKCLELQYHVGIEADKFRESGDTILKRNVDAATWKAIRDRVQKLNAAYQSVEKGDRYALLYVPGMGTTLKLNGNPLVVIEGADFAEAYFSIWLGDDPAKASFREDLVGD